MKRTHVFIASLVLCLTATAQSEVKITTNYLSNGLKVIIAEDHSEPNIHGSVIVHAGSKNEDPSATGVAHYFEHIMFKGTDRIGTTDWGKEKPILDSVSAAYDRLREATSDEERHQIQLEINRLNVEASKYAIANETDAILQQMGCTGLNAGTTYDYTIYYNTLPSNQLENWMEVYAERFRNPVYRLFQGELEAVYEERNMYANEMMYTFSRNIFTESFGEHPYSRDIIGLDDHLKNPQPSAMKKFYDKYYVASNMTLILVGDLYTHEALQMAEKYFSIWPKGEPAKQQNYNLPKFDSLVVKEVKQTPVNVGLMIFPGVPSNDPDELPLDVLSEILGENGRLGTLMTEGQLMGAMLMPLSMQDAGSNVILYLPKLIGQKHESAEQLIWDAIDSVKEGHFSDALLESIKMNDIVARKRMLESTSGIASLLETLEATGSDYEHWQQENKRLQDLTREDIMRVANKYFDRNRCTLLRSKMGFPKKEAAIKPDWEHLEAQNKGEQSPFAKHIAERQLKPIKPQVIDFDKEATVVKLSKNCNLYASKNPKNDLFTLTIAYHYGYADNNNIELAIDYFNNLGAKDMTLQQFNIELERLGGSFDITSDYDYCYLNISGLEHNMEKIIDLVLTKLRDPRHDQQQIDNIVEQKQGSKKEAKNDPSTCFSALVDYVLYGNNSDYINHPTIKEVKKMKGEDLTSILQNIYGRDGYVTFVGNRGPKEVATILTNNKLIHQDVEVMPQRVQKRQPLTQNTIYHSTNKQFIKSDIAFIMPSIDFDYTADRAICAMFNEYMGGGMNSVFFQEIREFRSLGYATYGRFGYDRWNRNPAMYFAYLGTQCDKTNDGIEAMRDLMVAFPERADKFDLVRDYLISARNSDYYTFRNIPSQIRYWTEVEKIDHDPRAAVTEQIKSLTYDDLSAFHKKYIEGKPFIVIINGNAKKYDLKALRQYGQIQEVKYNKMIRF